MFLLWIILKKTDQNRGDNLKIKHLEKHWIRKGLLITAIFILFFIIYYNVDYFLSKDEPKESEIMEESDFTYITKQVIDYENDNGKDRNVWETKHSILDSVSFLYKNNKYERDVAGGGIEPIVAFSPETYPETYSFKEQLTESKISGIIYELDLKASERYVASLLNHGYSMRRKILTSVYAEVYLQDAGGDVFRIFCLSDKMLMAQLDEDAPMPSAESYFK